MQRKFLFLPLLCFALLEANAQSSLSVEYIMRDSKWMGTFPSAASWGDDGKQIYFQYNKDQDPVDSLYKINLANLTSIQKVHWPEAKGLRKSDASFNSDKSLRIFREGNNLMLDSPALGNPVLLLEWFGEFNNPKFLANESEISFVSSGNIYVFNRNSKSITKATNIVPGTKPLDRSPLPEKKPGFLEAENLSLLQEVREREEAKKLSRAYRESIANQNDKAFAFYTEGKNISNLQLSPDKSYATFSVFTPSSTNKTTKIPDYTAASGYTEDLSSRTKVGNPPTKTEIGVYDLSRDTVYFISTANLPGIKDFPDYIKDYPEKTWEEKERDLVLSSPYFSPDGKRAIIQIRAFDNKDRWIAEVNLQTGELKTLDRQRDEAWIGGPGIGGAFGGGV
ncbi:MAG: S9 family peptidase, partial [Algoriphagus sp.]|nr:S9 family peptidase [Algoriphagus sp.]